ncbi:glycosyltransferase [Pseudomonas sp. NPDC078700]|uniref:glycosyltransferase n=1 Tax=Pseudomonas sp. NPDC078700 TaxID=3364424 RepID=UPI0037C9E4B5
MITRPRIAVLMASYNGIRWIAEQVDSICNQVDVDVHLYVSVDLSTDGTYQWLDELSRTSATVSILPYGEVFGGAAKNFYRLIRDVDFGNYDYVALADQDDIWFQYKLINAVDSLLKNHCSAYSSNVIAFWENGSEIIIEKSQPQQKYDYLFEAAGPGCTYVMATADLLKFKDFLVEHWLQVQSIKLHDWLIYAWYRSQQNLWFIDPMPSMRYRQHESNQVGANKGFSAMRSRLLLIKSGWYSGEVLKIASLVTPSSNGLLLDVFSESGINKYFAIKNFLTLRRKLTDSIFLAVVIVLGIY